MKILVCISNVPDTTTRITFTDEDTKFNSSGVQYIINPYDELALTRALELTETQGGDVTVIHVGLADSEANLRKALAIGAAQAVRINSEAIDANFVSVQICNYLRTNNFDLILTGRESIDYNNGLVGGLIAANLKLPLINVASTLNIENEKAVCWRDIDGGREKVEAPLPCVVSAQKELVEPRIPNMRGIMAARTKPLTVIEPVETEMSTRVKKFELPPLKGNCKYIDPEQAGSLINYLHQESKVI